MQPTIVAEARHRRSRPPSTRWYRLCGLVVLAGLAAAGGWWAWAVTANHYAIEEFARGAVRGPFPTPPELGPYVASFQGRVEVRGSGPHTLWAEGTCMSCAGITTERYRERTLDVAVIDGQGQPLDIRPPPSEWVFNSGAGREGRALYVVEVPEPGTYGVRWWVDVEDFDQRMPTSLALGEGVGLPARILRPMLAIAGAGVLAAVGLALLTRWRRQRWYRRRAELATAPFLPR